MIGNPNNAKLTQSGKLDSLFYLAGFVRDIHDHYHTRQDCWQQIGGYNDLYDDVFHIATDMYKDKFDFTYENEDYIFWAWTKFPISPLDETLYTSQLVPFNPRSKIPETASSI